MTRLFQNKYRISSTRLQNWNYANPGMYFVTICTADRVCYFGRITKQQMQLSVLGEIAEQEWIKTIEIRRDMNIELGEFVVMPNHFHGIVIIGDNKYNNATQHGRDAKHGVSTESTQNTFGPQSKNLASVIRGYKSAATTTARKNNMPFNWQPRFHEHIIRSAEEYDRISNYIKNNPAKWQDDKFYLG